MFLFSDRENDPPKQKYLGLVNGCFREEEFGVHIMGNNDMGTVALYTAEFWIIKVRICKSNATLWWTKSNENELVDSGSWI